MNLRDIKDAATPEALGQYARAALPAIQQTQQGHMHPSETVREEHYKGHHIVIRTSYSVTIDGVPIQGHLSVGNDGKVHYHAIPNVVFPSAVDLFKQLIDAYPRRFPGSTDEDTDPPTDDHTDHQGGHHGGHHQPGGTH